MTPEDVAAGIVNRAAHFGGPSPITTSYEIAEAIRSAVAEERARCAKIAENEPEPIGPIPDEARQAQPELLVRAAIWATKESIAEKIRG